MPKTASVDKVWKCGIFPHHTMRNCKEKAGTVSRTGSPIYHSVIILRTAPPVDNRHSLSLRQIVNVRPACLPAPHKILLSYSRWPV